MGHLQGVTTMDYMFYSASAFNQDISGWAVSCHVHGLDVQRRLGL